MTWQPIETAPDEEDARFLVWDGDYVQVAIHSWREEGRWVPVGDDYQRITGATHWMPLPPPPTE